MSALTVVRETVPPSSLARARAISLRGLSRVSEAGLLLPLSVILVWQVLAKFSVLDSFVFPAPSDIGRTFILNIANGVLLRDLWASALRILPGFALGSTVGLVSAILMAWFRPVETALQSTIGAVYTLPKIALLPMFALWFGIGEPSKIYLREL